MVKPDSSHQEKGEDSKAYTTFGDLYFSEGQYEDAIQQYVRALEANPDDLEAWNKLHNSLVNLGRADEAQSIASKIQEVKDRSTPPSTGTAPMKVPLLFKEDITPENIGHILSRTIPQKTKGDKFLYITLILLCAAILAVILFNMGGQKTVFPHAISAWRDGS